MLERDMTRAATKANPGFAQMLQKVRMTGAPIPSLAQMLGIGGGSVAQRKAGPDKVMGGITGASTSAKIAPKGGPQAGKGRFSLGDMFGMRK
jgi:hypothetical protein